MPPKARSKRRRSISKEPEGMEMTVGQIEKMLANDMGIPGFRVEMLNHNGRKLNKKIKVKKLLKD